MLGVFYGTSLIADEVDDKTITYLFTRPVRRGAVVVGKYIAYLVCTSLVVLPSVMIVYFLMVPFGQIPASFISLVIDLGVLGLGLAAYGALFALVGAALKRPLVVGLVFVFGWELVTLVMPGYLKRFTLAYYLQTLVPHAMPTGDTVSLLQGAVFRDPPSVGREPWLAGCWRLWSRWSWRCGWSSSGNTFWSNSDVCPFPGRKPTREHGLDKARILGLGAV